MTVAVEVCGLGVCGVLSLATLATGFDEATVIDSDEPMWDAALLLLLLLVEVVTFIPSTPPLLLLLSLSVDPARKVAILDAIRASSLSLSPAEVDAVLEVDAVIGVEACTARGFTIGLDSR